MIAYDFFFIQAHISHEFLLNLRPQEGMSDHKDTPSQLTLRVKFPPKYPCWLVKKLEVVKFAFKCSVVKCNVLDAISDKNLNEFFISVARKYVP